MSLRLFDPSACDMAPHHDSVFNTAQSDAPDGQR